MGIVLSLLSIVVGLASFVCWIIILIDMFKDEIWKGIVGLICGLYALYYALFEFDHERKWPIVIGAIFGGAVSAGLQLLGAS